MGTFVALRALHKGAQVRVPAYEEVFAPTTLAAAAPTGTDGSFAAATYYYKVTGLGDEGETDPSNEVSRAITWTNEVQQLVVDASSGTFDISFGGQTASAQAFDIPAATLQTNLRALSSIGGANVTVTGGVGASGGGTPYVITFIGTLAHKNVNQMTTSSTSLAGGAHTATVSTTTPGTGDEHIALTWDSMTGADSYRIYRGTGAGTEDHYQTSATNSFTDTGATGTAGTPPTSDTAATGIGQVHLTPSTDTIVDLDDIKVRRALNNHSSVGQYIVTAANAATATAGSLPSNS